MTDHKIPRLFVNFSMFHDHFHFLVSGNPWYFKIFTEIKKHEKFSQRFTYVSKSASDPASDSCGVSVPVSDCTSWPPRRRLTAVDVIGPGIPRAGVFLLNHVFDRSASPLEDKALVFENKERITTTKVFFMIMKLYIHAI